MKTPNWQHHSKKEAKRKLKPQALRQAKARRQAMKAKFLKGSRPSSPFSVFEQYVCTRASG
jgi:hypothetical protein